MWILKIIYLFSGGCSLKTHRTYSHLYVQIVDMHYYEVVIVRPNAMMSVLVLGWDCQVYGQTLQFVILKSYFHTT